MTPDGVKWLRSKMAHRPPDVAPGFSFATTGSPLSNPPAASA